MPQRMEPGIFRPALRRCGAGRDLCRDKRIFHDVGMTVNPAAAWRENEIKLTVRADQFPLAQGIRHDRRQRNRALTRFGLRPPYGNVTICPLPDILDNCDVRVAFATNDERTAKRVSDALGTATEMRAMKNYAGHQLSPWLGHLMVSRQERRARCSHLAR